MATSEAPEPDQAALVWFRRDLRVADHAALYHALKASAKVYCVFVFDREILEALPGMAPRTDRRVEFIHASITELDAALRELGGGLIVLHGQTTEVIPKLAEELSVSSIFTNHDYEPQAIARDARVAASLAADGRELLTFKDQVIFEKSEVLTGAGRPFTVFTPYKNAWLKALTPFHLKPYPVERYAAQLLPAPEQYRRIPALAELGFAVTNLAELQISTGASGGARLFESFLERIHRYRDTRDFPAIKGPSYLSFHLRFGTIPIRTLAREAYMLTLTGGNEGAATWLAELIWRDFYMMILFHNPQVVDGAFKRECSTIAWDDAPDLFAAWCEARTGYPLVDAAMRQLNQTGYMHNRLRMVVASFLTKDLGVDWQLGERYFAKQLNDFDLSANNGGWQWAASTGCDAQPWFRIFNPVTQSEKFDAQGKFIRRYVPELAGLSDKDIHAPWTAEPLMLHAAGIELGKTYPLPVVDHATARARTLERFGAVKKLAS